MRRPLAYALMAIPGLALAWEHTTIARAAMHRPAPSVTGRTTSRSGSDSTLWIEMRNVDLHIDQRNAMRVRSLRGEVLSKPGTIAWLDDPASFRIRATSGVVALDGDAISALLNEVAFNYPGAPITNLRVSIENGSVVQRGTLHKGVALAFQMWSVPELQPDGRLKLHPHKLTILGVNGISLMHALGLHLDKMMDLSKAREVSDMVQRYGGYTVDSWKPVVGKFIFTRESGGVAAQFHQPSAIEPYSAEIVQASRHVALGKKSGLANIKIKLDELGLSAPADKHGAILEKVKSLGTTQKRLVTDDEFRAMVKSVA